VSESGLRPDERPGDPLTEFQEQAAKSLLAHDLGVFVAPPGVGKTVVGTYVAATRDRSTLVLVHRKPLLDQWVAQLSLFLGLPPKAIGQIGGGKRTATGRLDVAMLQSLVRDGAVDDLVAGYGHVIVDECHHVPAASFERVMNEVKARYVTGLTATPYRRDGHQPIIHMQCGPVRFAIDPKSEAARRPFEHRLICRETAFRAPGLAPEAGIQELYAAMAADRRRNELILNDVIGALEQGRSPILLTERRDHLEYFAARLRRFTRHLVVLQGGVTAKARREAKAQLAAIPSDEERLILATGRYIGAADAEVEAEGKGRARRLGGRRRREGQLAFLRPPRASGLQGTRTALLGRHLLGASTSAFEAAAATESDRERVLTGILVRELQRPPDRCSRHLVHIPPMLRIESGYLARPLSHGTMMPGARHGCEWRSTSK
jgi:hypothetical protein